MHFREGKKRVKRKVTNISGGMIGIRMFGYSPFWLDRQFDKIHTIVRP